MDARGVMAVIVPACAPARAAILGATFWPACKGGRPVRIREEWNVDFIIARGY